MRRDQFVTISLEEVLSVDETKPPRRTWVDFIPKRILRFLRDRWLWPYPTRREEWNLLLDVRKEFMLSSAVQKNFINPFEEDNDPTKDKPYSELN
jgi:hypothetical protein